MPGVGIGRRVVLLCCRYCKGVYTSDYKKTIGVDFLERKITLEGEDMRLMIWDTAGQEEFADMTRVYYQGKLL